MRLFVSNSEFWASKKVNFVDDNNVFVGYDYAGLCCESYGWYIRDDINTEDRNGIMDGDDNIDVVNEQLDGWVFDNNFVLEANRDNHAYDEQRFAVFRLTRDDRERFLHLYNHHNGYYCHGFEFLQGETKLAGGCLQNPDKETGYNSGMNTIPTFADVMIATLALLFPMLVIFAVASVVEVVERLSK